MYPTNAYVIREATDADEHALRWLAELDSQLPLSGPALVGEIDGSPAAAVSLTDGRVIANPFRQTSVLTQILHMRYAAMRAYSRTPSLPERMHASTAPSGRGPARHEPEAGPRAPCPSAGSTPTEAHGAPREPLTRRRTPTPPVRGARRIAAASPTGAGRRSAPPRVT
jgi:hypothetical protein